MPQQQPQQQQIPQVNVSPVAMPPSPQQAYANLTQISQALMPQINPMRPSRVRPSASGMTGTAGGAPNTLSSANLPAVLAALGRR